MAVKERGVCPVYTMSLADLGVVLDKIRCFLICIHLHNHSGRFPDRRQFSDRRTVMHESVVDAVMGILKMRTVGSGWNPFGWTDEYFIISVHNGIVVFPRRAGLDGLNKD